MEGELIKEQRFAALPVRIGRNTLNDMSFPSGRVSMLLSNFHARVEVLDNRIFIRDVGSKNGVYVRPGGTIFRVPPDTPYDLAACNYEFFLGPQIQMRLEIVNSAEDAPRQSASGAVLGNMQMLASQPLGGNGVLDPPPLPPLPGAAQAPQYEFQPGMPPAQFPYGPSPLGLQPDVGPAPGGYAPAPNVPHVAERSVDLSKTGHFSHVNLETLAHRGLCEVAASLVPGHELRTAGDVARFVTKLHDAMEVFCRCFIPLREGHAQFVSSLDLQRAIMQRSMYRSKAYLAVEMAKDPGSVAAALLDWTDESLDAHKAVEGIFADLMIHQVAMLDGVMQGVRALLEELSPDAMERQLGAKLGIALTGRYKALWQAYCQRFEELSEEGQAFSHIFGREFTEAYRDYQNRRLTGRPPP